MVVNQTSMMALIRAAGPGFLQSWSHDGGRHWEPVVASGVDGAATKPALASFVTHSGTTVLVLAWNVVTRERMALSTSLDGETWSYLATLDNGTMAAHVEESRDFYPTVIASGEELLTVWSSYPAGGERYGHIMLGRTALPQQ